MPGYKGHFIGSVLAFLMSTLIASQVIVLSTLHLGVGFCACVIGGLFPDLDTPSKGRRLLIRLLPLILITAFVLGGFPVLGLMACSMLLPFIVNHRTIFHRCWFLLLCAALLCYSLWGITYCTPSQALLIGFFFFSGALAHLIADYGLGRRYW